MKFDKLFNSFGIHSENLVAFLNVIATLFIVGIIAWIVHFIAKKWLEKLILKISGKTSKNWENVLLDRKFFKRLSAIFIPIIIRIALEPLEWQYLPLLFKFIDSWIILAAALLLGSILDGINRIYEQRPISKNKPIKVFIQVFMIFVYCAATIIIISIFTGKSAMVLLGGLTAFAAILMLIFKDTILGLVAGVQLSANDMVRIGDWIVMPSSGADGDVLEINLATVKVQNWDKTITTIPTYKLVSESFTNWRGMEESKGRRIKRSVNIDVNSIHYLSMEELETLKESAFLKKYIDSKIKEIEAYNSKHKNALDARRLTNIGTFREYMESWLANNPNINLNMTHMVRQLQSTPTGVPLEIYCFSARQKWVEYEKVQSDIFDHVFAVMDMFHLKAFQYSGNVASES